MRTVFQYILWVLCCTLWTLICFIAPDFLDAPDQWTHSITYLATYILACGMGSFILLYFIGSNKYVTAFVLPIWAVLGAALSFYRIGYHVTLTPMLLDAVFHTNVEEALGVLSWRLIGWLLINILVAGGLIWVRWKKIVLPFAWLHAAIAIVIGTVILSSSRRLRNSVLCQRFPYNIVYYTQEYLQGQRSIADNRSVPTVTTVNFPDSLTVVLIIGEAARADHLQLNGYPRETTPLLAARSNIISFPNIFSEHTYTAVCIPHLFTRADSVHPDYQYEETSFIPVFRNMQYKTAWLSNQDAEPSFRHIIAECDTAVFANVGKSVYVFSQWLDECLLPIMDDVFVPRSARSLYIVHTIGSHWYYDNHVPQEMRFFQPTTTSRVVTVNTKEQLINSYDNTIRYMDYVVDSVISSLENERAIVIYQSDHGEALGEEGLYLHGHDIPAVQNPACIVWYSDKYAASYPDKIKALVANKNKRYRTDYLFYSILYAAGIEAEGDNEQVNIFR